jgi:hypothetical protein
MTGEVTYNWHAQLNVGPYEYVGSRLGWSLTKLKGDHFWKIVSIYDVKTEAFFKDQNSAKEYAYEKGCARPTS